MEKGENKKGHILIYTPFDLDCPPQLEKMLEDIKQATVENKNNLGIPESRQGLVRYFQPNYPLPDKFGNEIKPIK